MHELKKTARWAGVWYLGLGVTGMLGFLIVRPQLLVDGDAAATAANIVAHEGLARLGVALEIGIVATQALAAVWFYRLFRSVDAWLAGTLAAFGLVNAVAIMGSAGFLATSVSTATGGGSAEAVGLLYDLSGNAWGVGNLFFGLWLIPMGVLVARSGWMPRPLSWFLVAGGAGYIAAAFTSYLLPDATLLTEALPAAATVGEFWMIGYLLTLGVRTREARRDSLGS